MNQQRLRLAVVYDDYDTRGGESCPFPLHAAALQHTIQSVLYWLVARRMMCRNAAPNMSVKRELQIDSSTGAVME